ncbi:pentapeptide repeat-containing protein [Nodosilinea sp. AN01ver1]
MNALRGILEDLGITPPAPSGICPYKGLSYFDCNDKDYKYFYGREALTQVLLDRVNQDNFLAIVGASGSGKSSVLQAGLLQHLKDKGDSEICILVPGEHPLQSLARAFIDEDSDRLDRAAQQAKAEALIAGGADGLRRLVQNSEAQRVVLVVDQFEEAFTLCQDKTERQAFFETLLGGLEATSSQLCLILAMRSDFVGKCFEQDYGGLAEAVNDHLKLVLPMTTEELTQAIEEPARQTGVSLEPGLTQALLKDLEQSPGGLPLLQYTLTELWQRQQGYQLKLSVYHQLGGVTGTLKQRADQVYESLTPEQRQTAKHIFLSLTQLGEGAEDTRRRVTQDSLVSSRYPENRVTEVVKQLADANLVVTDDQGEQRTATVDVAHEALIRIWPKLRQWLDENRDLLRQQRKVELAAEEWKAQGYKSGYLLQGLPLIEAKQFPTKNPAELPLSGLANTFIQTSIRQQQINRLKTASWLLIPAALVVGLVEYSIRESGIKADYARLDSESMSEEKQAVQDLVAGCSRQQQMKWIPHYFSERIFGHCRSLIGASLSDSDLNSTNLSNANLSNATLSNADLRNVNLSNANLSNAYIFASAFYNANLSNANLSRTFLNNAELSANLHNADLNNAELRNTDLNNANLSNANLSNANLSDAQNLTESQLTQAKLCRTTLPDNITFDPNRDCEALGIDPETGEDIGL